MKEKAKGKAQTIRALKLIVKQLAWLDGTMTWVDGRIVYQTKRQIVVVDAALIAQSQRLLNRTRQFWSVASNVFDKPDAWLALKWRQLALAKILKSINGTEFQLLAQKARSANPEAIEAMIPLLTVEALCINDLPDSPALALAIAGQPAQPALMDLAENQEVPLEARALAFMVLGSIHRQKRDFSKARPLVTERRGWFERSYYWGLKYGLPPQPTLILRFLSDEEGIDFCKRYLFSAEAGVYFKLPASKVNQLLADGMPPANVIRIVECLSAIDPMAERLFEYRDELPNFLSAHERFEKTRSLRAEREEFLSALRDTIHELTKSSGSAAVPLLCCSFVQAMRSIAPFGPQLAKLIIKALDDVKTLAGEDQESFLKLLVRHHMKIWIHEGSSWPQDKQAVRMSINTLLHPRYDSAFKSLLKAMRRLGDADLINAAISADQLGLAAGYSWPTPQHCWLALKTVTELEGQVQAWEYNNLWEAITCFERAQDAQRMLEPILSSARKAKGAMQTHYLVCVMDSLSSGKKQKVEELALMPRLLQMLIRATDKTDPDLCPCQTLLKCAIKISRSGHDDKPWTKSVFKIYSGRVEMSTWQLAAMEQAVDLAIVLCRNQPECFEPIVSALCCHRPRFNDEMLARAVKALKQLPELHSSLNFLLPASPVRTLKLLVFMSLASGYSTSALSGVKELTLRQEGVRDEDAVLKIDQSWREIIASSPECLPLARLYVRARHVMEQPQAPPSGVERLLVPDARLLTEYEYLRTKFGQSPGEPKLRKRLISLKTRLENQQSTLRLRATQLLKRLQNAAYTAELEAIEDALNRIFYRRLTEITGRSPSGTRLDRFLLNALQLMTDVSHNKRLLKRLLIAHVTGDRFWRHNLPANQNFLTRFQTKGMNVTAWLKSHSQRYAIEGLGIVRLKLEEDPMHILEMGNHFDTCLSFGGCYSYSTVANACDLNKRVIYAYDKKGRVIARQLIAVSDAYKLVGFSVYNNLNDAATANKLHAAFVKFVRQFAASVGIELANDGIVEGLTTQNWYHDGAIDWESPDKVSPAAARVVKRHKEVGRATPRPSEAVTV